MKPIRCTLGLHNKTLLFDPEKPDIYNTGLDCYLERCERCGTFFKDGEKL